MKYTEDTLAQETTAKYLEQEIGWEFVYACNEDSELDNFWGRASECAAIAALSRDRKWCEFSIKPALYPSNLPSPVAFLFPMLKIDKVPICI